MVEKAVIDCKLDFVGVDRDFLVKFVSVLLKGQEPEKHIKPFLQIPKQRTSINSFLKKQSNAQFQGPPEKGVEDLSPELIRRLLSIACAGSVRYVMEHHYFTIAGDIFCQKDGSPIGLDLSVETASLYMSIWDQKFSERLRKLGIRTYIYKRYVDDIFLALQGIGEGWVYDCKAKKMKLNPQHQDNQLPNDQKTQNVAGNSKSDR